MVQRKKKLHAELKSKRMELLKQGMKGPARAAPAVPISGSTVNRYSPVTNWNDDPFGANVFEPTPQCQLKKKPPPRPPPPKVGKLPDESAKPLHFIRRPTVLTSLLSRKNKTVNNVTNVNYNHTSFLVEHNNDVDANKLFPKCEPKAVHTGALIDLSSPPSSPTFTTRSSSDGLSVDSFGSDATTSTNHLNPYSGGNASQAESGFEDDFDPFPHSRKFISKEDTLDDFTAVDPFSPKSIKLPTGRKVLQKDNFDGFNGLSNLVVSKGPTIIRAKPNRPKPPDNVAILKNTFGSSFSVTAMNVNTTKPIQKVSNSVGVPGDTFNCKTYLNWDDDVSPDREESPPMPSIPPPPPPAEDSEPPAWPDGLTADLADQLADIQLDDVPHAIAQFDYYTGHPDDLTFTVGARIELLRRVDDEWLFGSIGSIEGLFPSNYVEVVVPLTNEKVTSRRPDAPVTAIALYDFQPEQPGDLSFRVGDTLTILQTLNDQWYFGKCNGVQGQFPANYIQIN